MIEYTEAINAVLEKVRPIGVEQVSIAEAMGRVLAEDIISDSPVPLCDNSAMDGFAVIAGDVKSASEQAPARLEVIETIPAGKVPAMEVAPGRAARIMTGGVMPEGADSVVMVEHTRPDGDNHVFIMDAIKKGRNVRLSGEDVPEGRAVLKKGVRIAFSDLGMIATAGRDSISVAKRPVAGIISTGDEIIAAGETIVPGKVRNSNSHSLYGQCLEAGAAPKMYGIVADRKKEVTEIVKRAAGECDIILTSGGVSAGDFDEVKGVLKELGKIVFWKVRMKPGKPVVFGEIGDSLIFGLPGNPVSVMVCFELLARPAILKMTGAGQIHRTRYQGTLDHDMREKKPGRMYVHRGIATFKDGGFIISDTGPQGSGMLSSMVAANCMFIAPADSPTPKKGDTVEFFLIR